MKITARGEVGGNIREFRLIAGITQVELAERSKLHHTIVSKVEWGESEPDFVSVIKLAHSLGLTLAEVFRGPARQGDSL